MTYNGTDGQIDRLVRARWLEIGLSQADLAEVLDAAFQPTPKDGNGSDGVNVGRLIQVAEVLDIPIDSVHGRAVRTGQKEPDLSPAETLSWLQTLLALRLLQANYELRDPRAKRMLVYLAEQIVKGQANRRGDAG
jgi:hypothetical protein